MSESRQPDEEALLRSVALQTASSIRMVRQRAEEDLFRAKQALEVKTVQLERALLELKTELEITQVLVNAHSIDAVANRILEILCRNLSTACAQLWRVDRRAAVLRRVAGWCHTMPPADFHKLAQFDVMPRGIGLPGRILESRQPVWIEKIEADFTPPRAPLARNLGLKSVFGFPFIVSGQVSAMIELFSTEQRPAEESTLSLMATIGSHIGLFIEREAAEEEQRRALEEAREANRIRDRFLSIASHELKTPLTAILGWTAMLKRDDSEEIRAEALRAIEQSARTQAELIEDLLDASRIREGKLVLRPESMDLSSVVATALKTVNPAAEQRGVKLEAEIQPDLPSIQGDPARIRQVAANLLTNAIKFTPPGKIVRTTIQCHGDTATLTVEDQGEGINPKFLPHIFKELSQDEKGQRAGGLGLGLYIVKTIVEMHGGTVEAYSDGVGRGAKFVVKLPRKFSSESASKKIGSRANRSSAPGLPS